MNEEFIGLEEIADYCYLYEAFYYIILNIVPKKYKVNGAGVDIRLLYGKEGEEIVFSEEEKSITIEENESSKRGPLYYISADFMDDTLLEEISMITRHQESIFEKQVIALEEIKFYEALDKKIQTLKEGSIKRAEMEDRRRNFQNPYLTNKLRKESVTFLTLSKRERDKRKKIYKPALLENEFGKMSYELKGDSGEIKNIEWKICDFTASAKKDEAKLFFDTTFYEETLEADKIKIISNLFNFIENGQVKIGTINFETLCSHYTFTPKNISFKKLKLKIFMQHEGILVDFNSLRLAHGDFLESKGVDIMIITNGIQHLVTRNNTKLRVKGGEKSYEDRKAMRIKAKALIRQAKEELSKGTKRKIIIERVTAILKKTDPELVKQHVKTLNNSGKYTDLKSSLNNWYVEVSQEDSKNSTF